jgi:hypothetical protein
MQEDHYEMGSDTLLRPLHASFRDFLTDQKWSGEFR